MKPTYRVFIGVSTAACAALLMRGWVLFGVVFETNLGFEELSFPSIKAFAQIEEFLPDPNAEFDEVLSGAAHLGREPFRLVTQTLFGDRSIRYGHIFLEPTKVSPELVELLAQSSTYETWSGNKGCGGFHADLFVSWPDGARAVIVCTGCHEALIFHEDEVIRADLRNEPGRRIIQLLNPK